VTSAPGTGAVRKGAAILVGIAPFVMFPAGYEPAQLPQAAVVQVGALALAALALWSGEGVAAPWRAHPFGRPLFALLAWAALSALWAVNGREALQAWAAWAACGLLYLVVWSSFRRHELRPLLAAVFGAGAGVAILGILQHLFGVSWIPQAFPPAATFMNRNVAVGFVVASWPLGYALGRTASRRAALLWAAGSALQLAYLFYTFTKSGWVAVAAQGTLALVFTWRMWRARGTGAASPGWWLAPAAGAVLLLVLVHLGPQGGPPAAWRAVRDTWTGASLTGPERPVSALTESERVNSIRVRRAIWLNTAAMVGDRPLLGTGLGNHKVQYPAYARRWAHDPGFGALAQLDHVHNDYLQAVAEMGVVGVALGAWLLWTIVRVAWRHAADLVGGVAALGVVLGLAGILVDACFSFPLQRAIPPMVLAVFLGVLAVLDRPDPAPSSPARSLLAPAAVLLVLAVTAAAHWRVLAADAQVWRARQAEQRGDWPRVVEASRAALRHDPGRREAQFLAGTALLTTGRAQPAAAFLEAVVRRYPLDPATLANLAYAQETLGRTDEALASFGQAAALLPDDALLAASQGRLLEHAGRTAEAREAYRRAARFGTADPRPPLRAGLLAMRDGRPEEAQLDLLEALRRQPDLAEAHKALGLVLYQQLGRKDEARVHFRRALELRPGDRDAPRMKALLESP
jgi:Flp pilus assembly protein TadD/O-antigen ligase